MTKNNQPLTFKSTRWTQYEKDAPRRGVKDHNMKRETLRALRERCGLDTIGETMSKRNEYRNWTNRTATECFKQYNRQSSNPRGQKEENEILT
ncbi:hypothetical protein Glove_443g64 [Diversispora epigaea]|uniref:Uncharacterized protein n=1 Tax=Diversispora epigaea TaxID=1348612 RepID=A0A397GV59_9GLOM|nr:hypothetical protein Glove_443g64 [Diversispora epigaea]